MPLLRHAYAIFFFTTLSNAAARYVTPFRLPPPRAVEMPAVDATAAAFRLFA